MTGQSQPSSTAFSKDTGASLNRLKEIQDQHDRRKTAEPKSVLATSPNLKDRSHFSIDESQVRAAKQARDERESLDRFKASGAPGRHQERSEFRSDKWQQALDGLIARRGTGILVALVGGRGTGKTQLATELIRAAISAGGTGRYTKMVDVYLSMRLAAHNKGSEISVLERACVPDLLVLDELGNRGGTDWEDRLLTHLIDVRYDGGQDTVLISNQAESVFADGVGESIMSRLKETGGIIPCDWPSFR